MRKTTDQVANIMSAELPGDNHVKRPINVGRFSGPLVAFSHLTKMVIGEGGTRSLIPPLRHYDISVVDGTRNLCRERPYP